MKLSYVIVTHNRRDPLLKTLEHLHATTPLPSESWEAWVVDNASTDGTINAVRARFPDVHILSRPDNEGVGARSHAFGPARGEYLILLDDDSYPVGDTVNRSIAYLDEHADVAALVGRVVLPDGRFEACALPSVMLSGAVCLRKSVVDQVGGFRPEFFRKAGEYDFTFRILQAGWRVLRFEDLVYRHDKVATGRSTSLAHFMDLRNNLILIERFLPRAMRRIYRRDWLRRYVAIARSAGEMEAVTRAIAEARQWAHRERVVGRQTLAPDVVEHIFEWRTQQHAITAWARAHDLRRVVIADYSKNIYATFAGCRSAELDVPAIAATGNAFVGLRYRGVPIQRLEEALGHQPDGVVISNINPAQIDDWHDRIAARFTGPVLRLWSAQCLAQPAPSAEHLEVLP